jgi:hypothetical protein
MDPMTTKPGRRSFLTLITAALSPAQDTSFVFRKTKVAWKAAGPLQEGVTRSWLGVEYWANRLQDGRLHQGRMECLTGASGDEARMVAALTIEMTKSAGSAHLSVRTGTLDDAGGGGFSGFLIGAGCASQTFSLTSTKSRVKSRNRLYSAICRCVCSTAEGGMILVTVLPSNSLVSE